MLKGVAQSFELASHCQKTARAPADRSTTYCTPLRLRVLVVRKRPGRRRDAAISARPDLIPSRLGRSLPVVQLCLMAQLWQALVQ